MERRWGHQEAVRKLVPWLQATQELTGEMFEPIARVARMIERHLEGILVHWTAGRTTAFMDRLNSPFSAVNQESHGYRKVEYLTDQPFVFTGKIFLQYYGPVEAAWHPIL
jgi:hypothetical protein